MNEEAERLLTRLLSGLKQVLGSDLVGLYLFGSLATGDFEPGVSDVDTVAVLREDPAAAQIDALGHLHREIDKEMPEWRERVEVVYLSTQALATFRTGSSPAARISPGEPFHAIRVDHRWVIDWYQLREVGRALYGPAATTLVPTITSAEYVEAVRQHILDWPDPEVIEFQASHAYTIITLCRGLRTIRTGEHVSKRDAADWGCEAMPDHAQLIRDAVGWRERAHTHPQVADAKTRDATQSFLDDVRRRWGTRQGRHMHSHSLGDSRFVEATIRPYRETDTPVLVRLSLRAWAPVFASMRDVLGDEIFEHLYGDDWRRRQQQDVEEVLADEKMRVWLAEQGGQVVGFVAGILRVDEGLGEIKMLAVDPDFQNRGLGSRLTEVATDWIRESGQPFAIVSTGGDIGHAPARRTYEKAGYTAFPSTHFFKLL